MKLLQNNYEEITLVTINLPNLESIINKKVLYLNLIDIITLRSSVIFSYLQYPLKKLLIYHFNTKLRKARFIYGPRTGS